MRNEAVFIEKPPFCHNLIYYLIPTYYSTRRHLSFQTLCGERNIWTFLPYIPPPNKRKKSEEKLKSSDKQKSSALREKAKQNQSNAISSGAPCNARLPPPSHPWRWRLLQQTLTIEEYLLPSALSLAIFSGLCVSHRLWRVCSRMSWPHSSLGTRSRRTPLFLCLFSSGSAIMLFSLFTSINFQSQLSFVPPLGDSPRAAALALQLLT